MDRPYPEFRIPSKNWSKRRLFVFANSKIDSVVLAELQCENALLTLGIKGNYLAAKQMLSLFPHSSESQNKIETLK